VPIVLHKEQSKAGLTVPRLTGTGFVARAGVWRWLAVLVVYKTGDAFATAMLRPFLVDSGLDLTTIALLLGTVGSLASLAGAALGGILLARWGGRRALAVFSVLTALCLGGYALAAASSALAGARAFWFVLVLFEHVVSSLATVALFAGMMAYCRPGSEGGDYTLQASIVVICTGAAASLSGFSAAALGYVAHFGLAAAFTLLVGASLWSFPSLQEPGC
jgi:MFS transporter, PAT family, beta-lactamase induction signal transducer AmpG